MLYLHETHRVAGERADEFDAVYRDRILPAYAASDDARLLWYLHQTHGTGASYTVIAVTALRDGGAWERLARRYADGDLREEARSLEAMGRDSETKLLVPVDWSALQEVDLVAVPVGAVAHEPTIYMEDTAWPDPGKLDAYLQAAGTLYARDTIARRLADGTGLLDLRAAFRTLVGAHAGREVVLWQRVVRPEMLTALFTREVPPEYRAPGTWMHDALAFRDRWESRLLRTAPWSPLD
jgi:hypothetical protein